MVRGELVRKGIGVGVGVGDSDGGGRGTRGTGRLELCTDIGRVGGGPDGHNGQEEGRWGSMTGGKGRCYIKKGALGHVNGYGSAGDTDGVNHPNPHVAARAVPSLPDLGP